MLTFERRQGTITLKGFRWSWSEASPPGLKPQASSDLQFWVAPSPLCFFPLNTSSQTLCLCCLFPFLLCVYVCVASWLLIYLYIAVFQAGRSEAWREEDLSNLFSLLCSLTHLGRVYIDVQVKPGKWLPAN